MESILFIFLSVFLIVLSLLVISRTNPIPAAILLVFVFLGFASLYALLSAGFVATIQVLVYAGGILVLIIFVIMIMNLSLKDLLPLKSDTLYMISFGLIISGGALIPLIFVISNYLQINVAELTGSFGNIKEIGSAIFNKFVFAFEMLSILLLVAIIGALVIAKRKI